MRKRSRSFPDNYLRDVDVSVIWSDEKIQNFVENVCSQMEILLPGSLRISRIHQFLDVNVRFFLHSEMEEDEFLAILQNECDGDAILLRDAVEYLATRCSSLAIYIAYIHRLQTPQVDASTAFTPTCTQPLNRQLHMLDAVCKEPLIVRCKVTVKDLSYNLRTSLYLAVAGKRPHGDLHTKTMGMLAIRTSTKVFLLFPKLFPDLVESVSGVFRRDAVDKTVFVYKGRQVLDFLGDKYDWHPSTVDAVDICEEKEWVANLDSITEKTVGGSFCRRASQFGATSIPNTMVLKHRSMTVSLICSFGLKFGRLRLGRSTGLGTKIGGPQKSESATGPSRDRSPLRPRQPDRGGR
jgi:hypothetical protein